MSELLTKVDENPLSLRERVRPVLREFEGVRVGIFMPLCEPPAHDGSSPITDRPLFVSVKALFP